MKMGSENIARKLRIWYPGASYHLMERGVRRQEIFQDVERVLFCRDLDKSNSKMLVVK